MKIDEIRQLNVKEIIDNLKKAKLDLAKYTLSVKTGREADTSKITNKRRNIARLSTILNERMFLSKLNEGKQSNEK